MQELQDLTQYFSGINNHNLKKNDTMKKLEDALALFSFYLKRDRLGCVAYIEQRQIFLKKGIHNLGQRSDYEASISPFILAPNEGSFFLISDHLNKDSSELYQLIENLTFDEEMLNFPSVFYVFNSLRNSEETTESITPEAIKKAEENIALDIFLNIEDTFRQKMMDNKTSPKTTHKLIFMMNFMLAHLEGTTEKLFFSQDNNKFSKYIKKLNELPFESVKASLLKEDWRDKFIGVTAGLLNIKVWDSVENLINNTLNYLETLSCLSSGSSGMLTSMEEYSAIIEILYSFEKRPYSYPLDNPCLLILPLYYNQTEIFEVAVTSRHRIDKLNRTLFNLEFNDTATDAVKQLITYFSKKIEKTRGVFTGEMISKNTTVRTNKNFKEFIKMAEAPLHFYKMEISDTSETEFSKLATHLNKFLPFQIECAFKENEDSLNELYKNWNLETGNKKNTLPFFSEKELEITTPLWDEMSESSKYVPFSYTEENYYSPFFNLTGSNQSIKMLGDLEDSSEENSLN